MQPSFVRAVLSAALTLVLLTLGCANRQNSSTARLPRRNNVLLIIADDLGNDKVGVYNEGDDKTRPKTPNIDALAADGVRFVNAYANPVCSPTRATLLSGQYGFRTGIGSVIFHRAEVELPLFPAQIPIPIMLELGGAGYDHSQVGKWHLASDLIGGPGNPLQHGFNWTAGPMQPYGEHYPWMKQVNGEVSRSNVYTTTDTTDDAIARANSMSEPWFMWLAYSAPHSPFHVPPAHLHNQPNPAGDDVLMYAAMVEALDTELGRLLASIEPRILINTTIIFLGDNGTPGKVTIPPFDPRRAKRTLYEGGVNVPFIVSGPAVPTSSRGHVSRALVNTTDVYATVADIAGVDLAEVIPHELVLDSVSMLPLLADPDSASIRQYAFAEYFIPNGPGPYDRSPRAIRDDRWKLILSATPFQLTVQVRIL